MGSMEHQEPYGLPTLINCFVRVFSCAAIAYALSLHLPLTKVTIVLLLDNEI